jgi:hypothetical protein
VKKLLKRNTTLYYGDLSGISGDLDLCEITDEDRENSIDIKDLIQED